MEELSRRRLVQSGLDAKFTIGWNQMQGMRMELSDPDEEDLRSYLLGFRKFVAPGEYVHLDGIYNVCHTTITSDDLRGRLVQSREAWKDAQRGHGITITYNERNLTPGYVLDLWIDGYYFHTNAAKAAELRSIWPQEIARWAFLSFLVDGTRQVFYVGNVVRAALRDGLVAP